MHDRMLCGAACALTLTTLAVGQEPTAPEQPLLPTRELAEIGAAYAAKVAASAIFVSRRTLDSVLAEELAPTRPLEAMLRPLLRFEVDADARIVTCRLGTVAATAVDRGALGCALVQGGVTAEQLRQQRPADEADTGQRTPGGPAEGAAADHERPLAASTSTGIDLAAVQRALDAAFAEPDPKRPARTRAVVVVHRGRLVAERYASGYGPDSPLPGWSMTKTLTNALIGRRVAEGKFVLDAPPAIAAWRRPDDPHAGIGVRDLLTMTAGLAWNESYDDPASDALRMLFRSSDHAAIYAAQPVATPPGTRYQYASGATNLLCRLLRATFASDEQYWAYPRLLFSELGMTAAVLEADASGTFVGSSYGFASARDWARLGLLFAQGGVFLGRRLLPEGWVEQSATPHPASNGRFGMHVWLNADPDGAGPAERTWPDLPAELMHLDGHEGQYCVISPRAELVIVRLGCTKNGGFGLHALLRDLHAALPRSVESAATGR